MTKKPKKKRITDTTERYFCSECKRFHNKYRKTDGKKIKKFEEHRQYAVNLSTEEIWKLQFKENWKRASAEAKRKGVVNLPKRDSKKKKWGKV